MEDNNAAISGEKKAKFQPPKISYNREQDIRQKIIGILDELHHVNKDYLENISIAGLLHLKKILSSVNNLITLYATLGFVNYLLNRDFIDAAQAESMKATIQSQHANTNGYDIDFTVGKPVIAEVKCNIPVLKVNFGATQIFGIINDLKGLAFGKNKAHFRKEAYKFMVILNTDDDSVNTRTQKAIDNIMPKFRKVYDKIMMIPDDNASLNTETIYIVDLKL